MTAREIRFYQLADKRVDDVLFELLQKTHERGLNAVVVCRDGTECDMLNTALWTRTPESFLPHGSQNDGDADQQPIYLTTATAMPDQNPNQANVQFAMKSDLLLPDHYPLCCAVLDAGDDSEIQAAQDAAAQWAQSGCTVHYWLQDGGKWQKRA